MDKKLINRIIFYAIFLSIVGYAGYFIYDKYYSGKLDLTSDETAKVSHRYSGTELQTDILDDQKFIDLREVEVVSPDDGEEPSKDVLTDAEIEAIERRHSNPFEPFQAAKQVLQSQEETE